jgi:hypothetical protein
MESVIGDKLTVALMPAPAVFTATPASAHTYVPTTVFACSLAFSSSGSSFTYTSDIVTVNGVTVSSQT